ncbi:hypothetical protein BJN34_01895 [Cupriavidus necator]|uniref:Integrase n=2 Tax=Cupriavidus necator TaxID=106590 RepID=A0A1U9UJ49_CUPNE|nr:hypothetical protein BJN34_01895 [Cupriavidus necator]
MSLKDAIKCLMTACTILIAFMNARRKGEIIHPHIGLQVGNLKTMDASLEIFMVDFFLEKGPKKRVPYFVNSATRDAITVLDDLQRQFGRLDESYCTGTSLFRYRHFNLESGLGVWAKFDFYEATRYGQDFSFMVEALGANPDFGGTRVFRRLHAVLHYYRYENGDIQALSRQLGHDVLGTTGKYIGDSLSRPEFQSVFDISSSEVEALKRAAITDLNDLEKEFEEVGYEKLMEEILIVLNGGLVSGGYQKIIKRLALKVAGLAQFHGTMEEKAQAVFQAVKARGHFPKVYKHGQCMVGGTVKVKSAKCHSHLDGRLHQENASPAVCGECVYHQSKAAYIRNLTADRERMERRLEESCPGPFERKRLESDLENLNLGIQLLRKRLGL